MKKIYQQPAIEVMEFETESILKCSGEPQMSKSSEEYAEDYGGFN